MNLNDISTQLLFTTVPIWVQTSTNEIRSGTCFFVNQVIGEAQQITVPFLITNKHVVENGVRATLSLAETIEDKPSSSRIQVEVDAQFLAQRLVNTNLDLVAFPFGPILNQLRELGKVPFFRGIGKEQFLTSAATSELSAVEEVTFIGYPKGLIDKKAGLPIVRRGITASPVWNDFNGESTFLIDAGVFPGSSGSPVFLFNQGAFATSAGLTVGSRLAFLGIVSDSLVTKDSHQSFIGLGKVINAAAVSLYIDNIIAALRSKGMIS